MGQRGLYWPPNNKGAPNKSDLFTPVKNLKKKMLEENYTKIPD